MFSVCEIPWPLYILTSVAGKDLVSENTQQLDTKNPHYRNIPKRSIHWRTRACIGIVVSLPSRLQRSKD